MPGFNQIFQGLSQIRYHSAALDIIHKHFQIGSDDQKPPQKAIPQVELLPFNEGIELKNVTFSYPKSDSTVIDDLNLFIKANTTVAFVGQTGSGKTTLIDIILGLLAIDSGKMYIDGTLIERSNLRSWQKNIGYVPQQIYLADDTVTRNIAFGVPDEDTDNQAERNKPGWPKRLVIYYGLIFPCRHEEYLPFLTFHIIFFGIIQSPYLVVKNTYTSEEGLKSFFFFLFFFDNNLFPHIMFLKIEQHAQ